MLILNALLFISIFYKYIYVYFIDNINYIIIKKYLKYQNYLLQLVDLIQRLVCDKKNYRKNF